MRVPLRKSVLKILFGTFYKFGTHHPLVPGLGELMIRTNNVNSHYVQYGCGHHAPTGWRNFDASPTLRIERIPLLRAIHISKVGRFPANSEYGDITKGLPVPHNSCIGVYASHILEHLSLEDFRSALKNTFCMLKHNGCFRLVLPDLEALATEYLESRDCGAAEQFMRSTSLGLVSRPKGLLSTAREFWGNSRHLWMWDFKSMSQELHNVGFVGIRRCQFNDSTDLMFRQVEQEERFEGALAIECTKP
jgi:predicted SAM-dependent methyltransferase